MKTGLIKALFSLLLAGCIGNINNASIESRVSSSVHQMTVSDKSGVRAFSELNPI